MAGLKYTKSQLDDLIRGLYSGDINPLSLPEDLYLATVKYLLDGTHKGLLSGPGTIKFGEVDKFLIKNLEDNVYLFSGAKTFQQTLEMSEALVVNGEVLPFKEFQVAANEIFVKYNGGPLAGAIKPGWLEAEYNTAIAQAGNAKKWSQIEKYKEELPYLIYSTAGRACPICDPLDGVTLPVGHKFWKKYMPTNHFNCNCIALQAEEGEGKRKEWSDKKLSAVLKDSKVPEEFKFNPGMKEEIYSTSGKTKHPYFSVPKKYIKFAQINYGLPIAP